MCRGAPTGEALLWKRRVAYIGGMLWHMQAASEANGDPMAVWAKNPITGYGVLFFGVLPESRSDYEIEVIKENDTPTKVSGRFYGSAKVPERTEIKSGNRTRERRAHKDTDIWRSRDQPNRFRRR